MASHKSKTRQDSASKLKEYLGPPQELNPNEVPTVRSALQQGLFLRDKKLLDENVAKGFYTKGQMARDLAPLVLSQWSKSNLLFIPPVIIKENTLIKKIEKLWQTAEDFAWGRKTKGEEIFQEKLDKLLDITICRHPILMCQQPGSGCPNIEECKIGAHVVQCSCLPLEKLPKVELVWLEMQRRKIGEKSIMQMKGSDVKYTKKLEQAKVNKDLREQASLRKKKKEEEKLIKLKQVQDENSNFDEPEKEDDDLFSDDDNFVPPPSFFEVQCPAPEVPQLSRKLTEEEQKEAAVLVDLILEDRLGSCAPLVVRYLGRTKEKRNLMPVLNTAKSSLRYNVSPAAAAAIATGFLQDLIASKHLSSELAYLACDPSKLVRARRTAMAQSKEADQERMEEEEITAVYFDGRRDKTRALVPDIHGKLHPRIIKEEHIAVTVEPSGKYLTHFTPPPAVHPEKPALKEAEALYEVLQSLGATESCQVIGGDSTNSNTGWRNGSLAHLERLLGHKCQWVVCNIHTLELLLRHLIAALDGPTSSKDGYSGNVGKLLSTVEDMQYNKDFQALPGGEDLIVLPEDIVKNMSTDAQLCYRLCKAVKSGILPEDLQHIKCGPLSHARWLTAGQRAVYMWTRVHGLAKEDVKVLETLVKFCLQMYFKLYFDIKVKHSLVDAPHHILTQIRTLKKQPKQVRDILTFYVRKGAWYAHHENVLVSLLASSDAKDRKFAVDHILKLRGKAEYGDMSVRPRKTPKLNMSATTLTKLISWKSGQVQEPVFTCSLSKEEIRSFYKTPFIPPSYTSHTQSTERAVKQVLDLQKY